MNETEPSEKSTNQQNGRSFPPLAPQNHQVEQPSVKESVTVEKLSALVGKLQSMVGNSTKESAYQIERNIMAQKIKDLVEDLTISNENCDKYQQVIKLLAAKVQNLKIGNDKLKQENNMLQLKGLTSNKYEMELIREKQRTKTLLERMSDLKTQVTDFFTDQIESDLENVKVMKELREQNTIYKTMLTKISHFRDSANLDSLSLSDEFKVLNDDYCKFPISQELILTFIQRRLLNRKLLNTMTRFRSTSKTLRTSVELLTISLMMETILKD